MYKHGDDKVDEILRKYKMCEAFEIMARTFNYTEVELNIVNRYITLVDFMAHNYDMNKTEVRAMLVILFATTNPINLIPGSVNLDNLSHGFRTQKKYEIITYVNSHLQEHTMLSDESMKLVYDHKYPLTVIPQPKTTKDMFKKILMDVCVYTFGNTPLEYKKQCVNSLVVNAKVYYFKGVHDISASAIKDKMLLDLTAWQWYTQTVRTIAFSTNFTQSIKDMFK